MKKTATIFLLLFFLVTQSGMAVTMHWCGNRFTTIEFFSGDKASCPCGKKAMRPGCCHDKTVVIEVNNDLAKVNAFGLKLTTPEIIFTSVGQLHVVPATSSLYLVPDFYYPPPDKPKVPLYLLDGVFLI